MGSSLYWTSLTIAAGAGSSPKSFKSAFGKTAGRRAKSERAKGLDFARINRLMLNKAGAARQADRAAVAGSRLAQVRAIDMLVSRSKTNAGQSGAGGARGALARAAATRAAVANRPTARLGRAAAAAKYGDGSVDAYTRVQTGKTVNVRGYTK